LISQFSISCRVEALAKTDYSQFQPSPAFTESWRRVAFEFLNSQLLDTDCWLLYTEFPNKVIL